MKYNDANEKELTVTLSCSQWLLRLNMCCLFPEVAMCLNEVFLACFCAWWWWTGLKYSSSDANVTSNKNIFTFAHWKKHLGSLGTFEFHELHQRSFCHPFLIFILVFLQHYNINVMWLRVRFDPLLELIFIHFSVKFLNFTIFSFWLISSVLLVMQPMLVY